MNENQKMMQCPHCMSEIPHGAKVCRGCQAEIEYGTPPVLFLIYLGVSAYLGYMVGTSTWTFLGWIVGVVLFIGLAILSESKLFANRINFKRIYKTQ